MKKILVTGGTEGLGKMVVEHFAPHSFGISRRNGFDIRDTEARKKILELSLSYDIVLNHAFAKDRSQTLLLQELAECWIQNEKRGLIISTGTYGTHKSDGIDPDYIALKSELDKVSHHYSHRIEAGELPFRMTLIRPGMLDTQKSRNKPHWRGNGVTAQAFINVINFLSQLPDDMQIPDLVIESILARKSNAE